MGATFKPPVKVTTNATLVNGKIESELSVANSSKLNNKSESELSVDNSEKWDSFTLPSSTGNTGKSLTLSSESTFTFQEFATHDHIHDNATSSESGFLPILDNTGTKYLRDDGTWQTIPGGLELGETQTTAYRGDRGKTAYDHSQSTHAPTTAITASGVTYENLTANGDVGSGADQVANGNHTHDYSSTYAAFASGVTNGNTHDHSDGDGAQISYTTLGDIPASFTPSTHTHVSSDLTDGASTFATIDHTHTNASTTASGFLPILENTTTKYLRDDGTWQTISSGISDSPQITSKTYGRCNGSWVTVMPVVHVLSASTTAPPSEPANGDMYLLPENCTEDWEYMGAGAIVYYRSSNSTWHYYGEV